mmetsp:Transcript_18800/g.32376  ORF Transcript_18800/g.32376 Transcript_18800/m.32376 type:complete len:364 (-) Transcript_18800:104-1195(-)
MASGRGGVGDPFLCDFCGKFAAQYRCADCDYRNYCADCNKFTHQAKDARHHRFECIANSLCEHDGENIATVRCLTCQKCYCTPCSSFIHAARLEWSSHEVHDIGRPMAPLDDTGMCIGTTETNGHPSCTPGSQAARPALTLMLIGAAGVGKSSTINNLVGKHICETDAFENKTEDVFTYLHPSPDQSLLLVDTPGIDTEENLLKVVAYLRANPVHYMFYVERFDSHRVNKPLIQHITRAVGCSLWDHVFCVLTHGAMTPAKDVYGTAEYAEYRDRRVCTLQNTIGRVSGDTTRRVPVAVMENDKALNTCMLEDFVKRLREFVHRGTRPISLRRPSASLEKYAIGAGAVTAVCVVGFFVSKSKP